MEKERLDVLLVANGSASSRERAKRLIMAGSVLVNNQKIDKAGTLVPRDAVIRVLGDDLPYVSRGGLKLEKAVNSFNIQLSDKVTADIGASTGGFTDCMLQQGARKVYAIDVGYGQLAWKLRTDERVVNMERTNIRYVTPDQLDELPEFASIDVAFISLEKVLPVVYILLSDGGECVALIKPQFEAGREHVGKKGVVKDPTIHLEVIKRVLSFAKDTGFYVWGLTFSPVKGPEGNIEYLTWLKKNEPAGILADDNVCRNVVEEAHRVLD